MKRGIVIGKFYPPHKGHRRLIETARSQVDDLTVIVCHKEGQKISGELRAAWLRDIIPDPKVKFIVIPDIIPEDDSRAWAKYTRKVLGYTPDAVFTSEDYGDPYAKFLGCTHTLVDKERKAVPISATKIRENPLKYWEYLDPPVRAYFAKRVCVLGAESTGTTTLGKALAAHYKTAWVPEFGRFYHEGRMESREASEWSTSEFVFIAREQNRMEDQLARVCNKILICDTDAFATTLWHERYMGFVSEEVDAVSEERKYDMYFLTDIDIPFVQDGRRDGEHIREKMHKRFEEELQKRGKSYVLLSGPQEERLKKAAQECDRILSECEAL